VKLASPTFALLLIFFPYEGGAEDRPSQMVEQGAEEKARDKVSPGRFDVLTFREHLDLARTLSYMPESLDASLREYALLYKENPTDADVQIEYAAVLSRKDRYEEAARLLESALLLTISREQEGEAKLHLARLYHWSGRAKEAVALLRTVPETPEKALLVKRELAKALVSAKEYSAALAVYEQLMVLLPGEKEIFSELGDIYYYAGDHKKAIEAYEKAKDLGAKEPRMLRNLALSLSWNGQREEASKVLPSVYENFRTDQEVVIEYARHLEKEGKPLLAESVFHSFDGPESPEVLQEHALLATRLGHAEEAYLLFDKLLKREPLKRELRLQYAGVLQQFGDAYHAAGELTLLRKEKDEPVIGLTLADLYLSSERYDEAEQEFRAVLEESDPTWREDGRIESKTGQKAYIGMIRSRILGKDFEAARKLLRNEETVHGQFKSALLTVEAELATAQKRDKEAEELLRVAREIDIGPTNGEKPALRPDDAGNPDTSISLTILAEEAIRQGLLEKGLAHYKRALELDGRNQRAVLGVAQAYTLLGRYNESLPMYEENLGRLSTNRKFLREYAQALAWSNQSSAAQAIYRRMLTLDRTDPTPAFARARLSYDSHERQIGDQSYALLIGHPVEAVRARAALERQAMHLLSQRKVRDAMRSFRELLDIVPGDLDIRLRYAQLLLTMGRTEDTGNQLDDLRIRGAAWRQVDELEAQKALLERRDIEIRQSYWSERGRERLIGITRSTTLGEGSFPQSFGRLTVTGGEMIESPKDGGSTFASHLLGVGFQTHATNDWRGLGRLGTKWYDTSAAENTWNGELALSYEATDFSRLTFQYLRTDEVYNLFGILAGTQRDSIGAELRTTLSREWEFFTNASYHRYSDSNKGSLFGFKAEYRFDEGVSPWRIIGHLEYRDTQKTSLSLSDEVGHEEFIYPYWTPQDFIGGSLGLLYYRAIGEDTTTTEIPPSFYEVSAELTNDSDENPGIQLEARFDHRLSIGRARARVLYMNSQKWDAVGGTLDLVFKY
jgi:tetratricopeptide (TPR) repeat protein